MYEFTRKLILFLFVTGDYRRRDIKPIQYLKNNVVCAVTSLTNWAFRINEFDSGKKTSKVFLQRSLSDSLKFSGNKFLYVHHFYTKEALL